jgi:uncharacterized membrane protein
MPSVSTIITIHKPLKKAFDSFLDENIMAQWISGFQKIEIIRGEPKKQHSKYIMTIQHDSKPVALVQELVEVIEDKYLYVRTEHPDIITYSEITFHQEEVDVTKVHCVCSIHGKGFKVKMMMPVVKKILENRQWRNYKTFRELVEAR